MLGTSYLIERISWLSGLTGFIFIPNLTSKLNQKIKGLVEFLKRGLLAGLAKLSVNDVVAVRMLIGIVIAIFALLLFDLLMHPLRLGHDQALHYQMGLMLLDGKVPFVDMYDSNPPMIYYIDTIPGLASRLFHIHPIAAFLLFIWFLCVLSSAAMFRLVSRYSRKRFVLPLLVMAAFYSSFSLFLGLDYGQREHICVLGFVPFLLLRWLRWTNTKLDSREAMVLGVMAGIGLCLKHYFLIIVGAVELFWLLKYLRLKPLYAPECLAAFGVGVLYLAHFLLVPAGMRSGYFGYMVPIYAAGYSFWDTTLIYLLDGPWTRIAFLSLPIGCIAALSLSRFNTFFVPIVVYTLSGLIIYAMQYKGWYYHAFPCVSGVVLAIGLSVGTAIKICQKRWLLPRNCLLTLAIFGALYIVSTKAFDFYGIASQGPRFDMGKIGYTGTSPNNDLDDLGNVILTASEIGDPILFFCNSVRPGFPLTLQLKRKPGSRFLHAIPLSLFRTIEENIKGEKAKKLLAMEPQMMQQYEQDIQTFHPKLIFIQIEPVGRYLNASSFVTKNLGNYYRLPNLHNYEIYKLREPAHASP